MSGQALAIRIPRGVCWEMTPDYDGVTLSLHLSGDEDYRELGSAFVGVAVMLLQKAASDQPSPRDGGQPTEGKGA